MEAFNKCPECGEIDVRRTRCSCGYGSGAQSRPPTSHVEPIDDSPELPPEPPKEDDGNKERLLGAFLLFVGIVMSYLCIYEPLAAAARKDESISLSLKGAALCPGALAAGVLYLVLGKEATRLGGTRQQPSPIAYAFSGVFILLGILLYFYLEKKLEQKGYTTKRRAARAVPALVVRVSSPNLTECH